MGCAGLAQPEVVTRSNMRGGAQSDRRHSCRDRRRDAAGAILDDQAGSWIDPEFLGREQEDVGMRLAAPDHVGAEYIGAETVREAEDRQAELQAVDRTG